MNMTFKIGSTIVSLITIMAVGMGMLPFAAQAASYNSWCSITVDQTTVPFGGSTTLRWDSEDAMSGWIDGIGSVKVNQSGSRSTGSLFQTTSYQFRIGGSDGHAHTCSTTVYVQDGYSTSYDRSNPHFDRYSTAPQPACSITTGNYRTGTQGYDRSMTLLWQSTNAKSGYISGLGAVGVNGMYTVFYPNTDRPYTLTVYGPSGTSVCSTNGQGSVIYPAAGNPVAGTNPYLSLTQIPYTGFGDTVAVVVYFAILAAFALAGAHLVTYYNGGTLRLAFAHEVVVAGRNQIQAIRRLFAGIL